MILRVRYICDHGDARITLPDTATVAMVRRRCATCKVRYWLGIDVNPQEYVVVWRRNGYPQGVQYVPREE